MTRRRVIIDCDPGVDDALALMLAHGSPELEVAAVTVVGGNQTLKKVTRNALALTEAIGLEVPVAAGAADPLERQPQTAGHVHGDTGLGQLVLAEPQTQVSDEHAVDLIIREILAAEPGTLTLIALGPLTNLALAAQKAPEIVERVQEIVLMGGAIADGNITPVAEFNIAVDPEAARIVFAAGWPVTMVGLDVTHTAVATSEIERSFAELGTDAGRIAVDLISSYRAAYQDNQDFSDPPCHDPVAVAAVIRPELLTLRRAPIDIECSGELATGMTVVDLRGPEDPSLPTAAATALDVDGFWQLVLEATARLQVHDGALPEAERRIPEMVETSDAGPESGARTTDPQQPGDAR
ncbi:nucleoside hydrolase [Kocuria sp. p3-SID1433]|uniref:nucleoside hydrolase n=1 Tax=unclassified Kocuria TaxID=2649579 RepID=UPI0021A73196|nr:MULTISPECIES: nucleoside hydrolase [unclassified Kocuria]MCT1601965.1 nucleoside hydrolase [Kocuria sp. p3-SID1428]MCT2180231.1 nucleoside hydrolase [Kocuria sp. p3-SID1433]